MHTHWAEYSDCCEVTALYLVKGDPPLSLFLLLNLTLSLPLSVAVLERSLRGGLNSEPSFFFPLSFSSSSFLPYCPLNGAADCCWTVNKSRRQTRAETEDSSVSGSWLLLQSLLIAWLLYCVRRWYIQTQSLYKSVTISNYGIKCSVKKNHIFTI